MESKRKSNRTWRDLVTSETDREKDTISTTEPSTRRASKRDWRDLAFRPERKPLTKSTVTTPRNSAELRTNDGRVLDQTPGIPMSTPQYNETLRQYDEYQAAQAERDRLADYDVGRMRRAASNLQSRMSEAERNYTDLDYATLGANAYEDDAIAAEKLGNLKSAEASLQRIRDLYDKYQSDISAAERIQTENQYRAHMDAPDFADVAQRGAELENPSLTEADKFTDEIKYKLSKLGIGDGSQNTVPNVVTFGRENADALKMAGANLTMDHLSRYGKYQSLTDEETQIYNYLLASGNKTEADKYLEFLEPDISARESQRLVENVSQYAREKPVAASAASVPLTLGKGIGAAYGAIQQERGEEIDPNSQYFGLSKAQSAIRGTVSSDIVESIESEFLGNTASFLYQTGMSIADSSFLRAIALTTGGGSVAIPIIMGMGAASDTMVDALERGASSGQALASGVAAGLAEMVFEKVSLDSFIKMSSPAARNALLKNIFKQAGIEGSEEVFTELANLFADSVIMGDKSQYNINKQAYIGQGMTPAEAEWKATQDGVTGVILSGLGGVVSGGLMGGGASVVSSTGTRADGRALNKNGVSDVVIRRGLTYEIDTDVYKLANAINSGDTGQSNANIGRLYNAMLESGDIEIQHIVETAEENQPTEREPSTDQEQQSANAPQPAPEIQDNVRPAQSPALPAAQPGKSFAPTGSSQLATAPQTATVNRNETNATGATSAYARASTSPTRDVVAVFNDSGSPVTVQGIASVEDGDVYVSTTDGSSVALHDISIDSIIQEELYEAAAKFDTVAARALVENFDGNTSPSDYIKGFTAMYNAARLGTPIEKARTDSNYAAFLTPGTRQAAYNIGLNAGPIKADIITPQEKPSLQPETAPQAAPGIDVFPHATTIAQEAQNPQSAARARGETKSTTAAQTPEISNATPSRDKRETSARRPGVTRNIKPRKLSREQRAQIRVLDAVSKELDIEIILEDGTAAPQSEAASRNGANGWYDPNTDIIHINVDAAESAYMYVAIHELTHYIKEHDEQHYRWLEAFILSALENGGQDIDALTEYQKTKIPAEIRASMSAEQLEARAREEVIANSAPVILTDEASVRRIVQTDRTLAERIAYFFDRFMNTLRDIARRLSRNQRSWAQLEALQTDMDLVAAISETFFDALTNITEARMDQAQKTRFSLADAQDVDVAALAEENKTLKRSLKILEERFALTSGHQLGEKSIRSIARQIRKETGSAYDINELTDKLKKAFDYLANADQPIMEEFMAEMSGLMKDVLEQSSQLDRSRSEGYESVLTHIKKTRISLNAAQKQEVRYSHDSYGAYRRSLMSYANIADGGIALDAIWGELHEMAPDLFPADIPDTDMPAHLADVIESMKPRPVNPFSMNMDEFAYDLAMRMFDKYFEIPEVKSWAQKQIEKYNRLALESKNAMQALRRESRERERVRVLEERKKASETRRELLAKHEKAARERRMEDAKKFREQYANLTKRQNERMEHMTNKHQQRLTETRQRVSNKLDSIEARELRDRIAKNVRELSDWLIRGTDKKHIPESKRYPISRFIESIDFAADKDTIAAHAWRERLRDLNDVMRAADDGTVGDDGSYMDIDPDLFIRMLNFIHESDGKTINELNVKQLNELDFIVRAVKKSVTDANALHANANYAEVSQVAEKSVMDLRKKKAKKRHGAVLGMADQMLNIEQLDSFSYFKQLGNAPSSILNALRNGFDKKINRIKRASEYMSEILEGIDVSEWSGRRAEIKTFSVAGGELRLTKAQIMELYLLNKRQQARGHIYGGGIKPEYAASMKMKADAPVVVTEDDVRAIIDTLTSKEKEIADKIQRFLGDEVAAWGNETSMEMYGYLKFIEKNYYPIKSDSNYNLAQDPQRNNGIYALRNTGMTKATVEGANNPIMLNDIFDTITRHVDDMATYNAFVAPLSDAMKWYNYRNTNPDNGITGSVKESIERTFGEEAKSYFIKFIQDINGAVTQKPMKAKWLFQNAKVAAVGANIRVILQQPTAYIRAMAVMSPKYLFDPRVLRAGGAKLAREYSPIAQWKSWGFFQLDTGKSMRDIIVGDSTFAEKLREKSLVLAGLADDWTWGRLWNAATLEVRDTRKDLKPGTEAFYEAVGARLSEIVDATQVVDSVFHRSQAMRGGDLWAVYTAFMAEPTKSYNMLRNAYVEWWSDKRNPQKNAAFLRTAFTFTLTAYATALAAALPDALRNREDEDEEGNERTFWTKYKDAVGGNFADNWNPINMIPLLRDVMSIINGFNPSRLDLQAADKIINVAQQWMKMLSGDAKWSTYKLLMESAKALSSLVGIPASNLWRDIDGITRTILKGAGIDAPSWLSLQSETATMGITYKTLHDAIIAGDAVKIERLRERLANDPEHPKSPKEIDTGIADVLKEDPRIARALDIRKRADWNALMAAYAEIKADGFSQDIITQAINAHERSLAEKKGKDLAAELDLAMYDRENLMTAISNAAAGGDATSVAKIRDELIAHSDAADPAQAIKSAVTTEYRPEYIERVRAGSDAEAERLARVLISDFAYAQSDLDAWVMDSYAADMKTAIAAGDPWEANEYINELQDMGREPTPIKTSITSIYKSQVIEMYENGDYAGISELATRLSQLELYDTKTGAPYYSIDTFYDKWIKEYENEKYAQ